MIFKPCDNLDEINDAFTGGRITGASPAYRCTCGLHYQQSSLDALAAHNSGACIGCGSSDIKPLEFDNSPVDQRS